MTGSSCLANSLNDHQPNLIAVRFVRSLRHVSSELHLSRWPSCFIPGTFFPARPAPILVRVMNGNGKLHQLCIDWICNQSLPRGCVLERANRAKGQQAASVLWQKVNVSRPRRRRETHAHCVSQLQSNNPDLPCHGMPFVVPGRGTVHTLGGKKTPRMDPSLPPGIVMDHARS